MLNQQLYNIHQLINTAEYINEKKEYYARIKNLLSAISILGGVISILYLAVVSLIEINMTIGGSAVIIATCLVASIFCITIRSKVKEKYERESSYSDKILDTLQAIIPDNIAELTHPEIVCLTVRLSRFGIVLK